MGILHTKDQLSQARMLALKCALSVEMKTGLKHSKYGSVSEDVRVILGVKTRRKAKLFAEYVGWLELQPWYQRIKHAELPQRS